MASRSARDTAIKKHPNRLLKLCSDGTLQFVENFHDTIPRYAILSHTWGADEDEPKFADICDGTGKDKAGYAKVEFCGQQAKQDGLDYFWVDTCCVDKKDLVELSEAINSMFEWYHWAEKCYVYLADVPAATNKRDHHGDRAWEAAFRESRWHTRGWTLQELLAPASVHFYSREQCLLGNKNDLSELLQQVTRIPSSALQRGSLSTFSVEERMQWAKSRSTKKAEDKWYSLLGIFGVHMSLIYGEGENAEIRLKDGIARAYRLQMDANGNTSALTHVRPSNGTADRRQALLESLGFEQMESRKATIKEPLKATCRWILEHPDYRAWLDPKELEQHHGFLWISGKPGAGKSTLMKFAHAHAEKQKLDDEIVISFFFNARGDELEKSTLGMWRSLLLQLLRGAEEVQPVLDNLNHALGYQPPAQGPIWIWTIESLPEIFSDAVARLGQRPLKCFVDALDECDEEKVREMIFAFEELGEKALEAGQQVRFCLASRHYPTIDIRKGRQMTLEHEVGHSDDLRKYVQRHLRTGKGKAGEEIRGLILDKANGVFMWAVLVVEILNKEFVRGAIFAVKKRLQEIPPQLSDLFRNILVRDNANMEDLLLCLQWVLFAKRPLRREEYYYAMVVGLDPDPMHVAEWDPEQVTIDDMTTYLKSSSKGLAELTKGKTPTVQFIHESVRDFLIRDGGLCELWPSLQEDVSSLSHDRLKSCCQTYLGSNAWAHEIFTESWYGSNAKIVDSQFPFVGYASRYILYHAEEAARALPQLAFLRGFNLESFVRLTNAFERYKIRLYTPEVSLIYILAENGFARLTETACHHTALPSNIRGERYKYPLFAALENGHENLAQALLRHGGYSFYDGVATWPIGNYPNPLFWALSRGYTRTAELLIGLIQDDSRLDVRHSMDRSALSVAAGKGYERVVGVLLRRGVEFDSRDKSTWRPLHHAAHHGRTEVVRLLLEHGSAIEDEDHTPLYLASEAGHESIVRLLLERGANVNAQMGVHRLFGNALQAASRRGHVAIVQLLLEQGANVNTQGGEYGNALQAASVFGYEAIVQLLLKKGADVNAQGGYYGNALQAASANGYKAIVRRLLERGADVNAQGGQFDSALQAAQRTPDYRVSEQNRTAIIQMLKDAGATEG